MIWHSEKKEVVAEKLNSQPRRGLNDMQVGVRLDDYGENTVTERKKKSKLRLFIGNLFAPVSLILIIISAALLATTLTDDAILNAADKTQLLSGLIYSGFMLTAAVVWAAISTHRERLADTTIINLQEKSAASVCVLRNQENKVIDVEKLVPGDIVMLEAGDIIPADGRLLITTSFTCDESLITGDSTPIMKDCEALLPENTPLEERINMVYSGTVALSGRALMMVTETGSNTQMALKYGSNINKINSRTRLVANAKRLRSDIALIIVAVCIGMLAATLLRTGLPNIPQNLDELRSLLVESDIYDYIAFALTLIVCVIPFGLPQSTIYSLARGAKNLETNGVTLRSFKKAEVIGCTSIICTDKTGTLTMNQMSVAKAWPFGDTPSAVDEGFWSDEMKYLMQCSALCCDSVITQSSNGNEKITGDQTEAAIISAYVRNGNDIDKLFEEFPRVAEIPFDSSRKLMTVIHDVNGLYLVVTKGAPDVLVEKCTNTNIDEINRRNAELCGEGLRVIAVAVHALSQLPEKITAESVENELTFIGLIGMLDPHREDVEEAVHACSDAGIRTVMITGDHPATACSIARRLGIMQKNDLAVTGEELAKMSDKKLAKSIEKYSVFARITPEDKIRLIKAWQAKGHCVLMTAGGLGDAPALHCADISCTVKSTATDVAVDAADVTLPDRNFVNISSLIKQGRLIKRNISKLTEYCISTAIAEGVTIILGKMIFGSAVLKLLPIMLLNLLVFWLIQPAFAREVPESDIMLRTPEINDGNPLGVFGELRAVLDGIATAMMALFAYAAGTGFVQLNPTFSQSEGLTMAFITITVGILLQAICARSEKPLFCSRIFKNGKILLAIFAIMAVALAITCVPHLNSIFGFVLLSQRQWCEIGILSAVLLVIHEYPKFHSYVKN